MLTAIQSEQLETGEEACSIYILDGCQECY